MKIIQLIQKPQLRGAEIFACQLSNHLVEKGHQVMVVSIFEGESQLPFLGKTIHLNRPLSKRFFDFKGWKRFNEIINDFGPDIVQSNAADTLKFAVSSKIVYSWQHPLIYRNANKMGDFINSQLKWKLNKFYLSRVAYVISVSRECEKDFIQTFRFSKDRIETVEIGVEDQDLKEIPEDLKEIFEKGPVVSHIGGFVPEKNHKGLIRIFNKYLTRNPDTQLLLLGKGKLQEELQREVKDIGIENNVHFLGYRTDVLDILHHADVFVLPSLIEGLPAVILEAMFCETPVIAYDVGGVGEVVRHKETGWLVTKGDETSFGNALEEVIERKGSIAEQVSAAKKMISDKFINDKVAERFVKAYDRGLHRLK